MFTSKMLLLYDTIRETKLDTRVNGRQGMTMFVQKQSGGNTVKVTGILRKHWRLSRKTFRPT